MLLILINCLSNCIAIRSSQYSEIKPEELKVASDIKSKIFIDWRFSSTLMNNAQQNVIDKAMSDQRKIFIEAIKESNCCEIVSEKEEADLFVKGSFYDESSKAGIYAAFVSGLTFTALPCWINSKIRISAHITKGKLVRDYDVKDSFFSAIWAPLIIATPFANSITVEAEVNKNLYKTLLTKMKKDGFFGK
jgi:hypothetical protein